MDKFILGKLTGSDIGIIVVAGVYLVEKIVTIVLQILGKKDKLKQGSTCPVEVTDAIVGIHNNVNILKAQLTASDRDGRYKIYVRQSLYEDIKQIQSNLQELETEMKLIKDRIQ